MADETKVPLTSDTIKVAEEPTRPTDALEEPVKTDAKPAEDGDVATSGDTTEDAKPAVTQENGPTTEESTADAKPDTTATGEGADAVTAAEEPATNGTPASKANNGRRKSTGAAGGPGKKTPGKKKKPAPEPRLNVQPGEMYMVAMRGYQPWPVIICDEEMLPESLISKRPVSAKRIDGTYREDFREGGKNAKDRRYPVMFLGTNEFAWQVNTELLNFDLDEVKKDVDSGNNQKKNKHLWEAYQIAAEGHDLAYFKEMLANHEQAMQEDAQQKELKEQQKLEKKEKAAKRKSQAIEEAEDVEMEDAGDEATPATKKGKGLKKRKKGEESDGENEKPAKTPKTKLKLTNKTPKEASAAKPKKETKSKKKASEEAESIPPEEPPMTEEERLKKREKQVLYLRHRLQKGFLSRDQAPKDEDMSSMSEYLKQLEAHEDLEADVIKNTKVHKVLKAIIKLSLIPKEEEFQFKKRSNDLLGKWSGALSAETEPTTEAATATKASAEPTTNGVKHEKEKETADSKDDTTAAKASDGDGDVSMAETKEDAPAVKADSGSVTDTAAEPIATTETATA